MNLAEFFKDRVRNPQAKSIGTNYVPYVSFSVSNEICNRDEDEVKKLVSQYQDWLSYKGKPPVYVVKVL